MRGMANGGDDWVGFVCASCFGGHVGKMLSVGCGDGHLERSLANRGFFDACDALDISDGLIRQARELGKGLPLTYWVADANMMQLSPDTYDAIWFHSSLHHVERLEHVLDQVVSALRPNGMLVINEYVGPTRFAFTVRQKEAMSAAWKLIPARFKRSCMAADRGRVRTEVAFPNPAKVAIEDPSEAVRSGEIVPLLEERFTVVHRGDAGGSLLQFLLSGIAGNFSDDDPDAQRVLGMLMEIEDSLLATRELQSDFSLIVARPR